MEGRRIPPPPPPRPFVVPPRPTEQTTQTAQAWQTEAQATNLERPAVQPSPVQEEVKVEVKAGKKDNSKLIKALLIVLSALCFGAGIAFLVLMFI